MPSMPRGLLVAAGLLLGAGGSRIGLAEVLKPPRPGPAAKELQVLQEAVEADRAAAKANIGPAYDAVDPGYRPQAPGQAYPASSERVGIKKMIMDIGGGTGASISGTGDTFMDRALLRRMKSQDKAVMMLLLLAYAGSLFFSATVAYKQAHNSSDVMYYADPRYHQISTDAEDVETFLETFNQPPSDAQLQVTGMVPLPYVPEGVGISWLGAQYRIAFSFGLDLSPWLVPAGTSSADSNAGSTAGVAPEDVELLRAYLAGNTNSLSYIELQKTVEWKGWEELATNIKQKIRQDGFTGVIHVHHGTEEVVGVHKNQQWANFMHSRTTKVLIALSVFGWFLYSPYMWWRNAAVVIPCKYRVDVDLSQYWSLIQDKISPDGFEHTGVQEGMPRRGSSSSRRHWM